MGEHGITTGTAPVREGDLLWSPDPEWIERTNLVAFMRWLESKRGLSFSDYDALWGWSTSDLDGFWRAILDYFHVQTSTPAERVLGGAKMPGAEWFPGARLNYAQHVLRGERPGTAALLHLSENAPLAGVPWETFSANVRIIATQLRAMGVRPGQRVVAYLPNIPEAVVAMVATTAIGAVWAGCSPDFGWRGASDRFAQLEPTVLFTVDGYRYGGKAFDRREEVRALVRELGSLEHVVYLPRLLPDEPAPPVDEASVRAVLWDVLLDHAPVPAEGFEFEQVPFDHPLWVLFSSGTTGLPKAIVHGHGGILLEQLKLQTFHMDLCPATDCSSSR